LTGYEEVHVPALKPKTFEPDEVNIYNFVKQYYVFDLVFKVFDWIIN